MKGNLNLPLIKGTHVKARRIAFSRAVKMELWVVSEEHLNSPQVFSRIRVTRSLVLSVCFVDRSLSVCTFSFGHCVVCSSAINPVVSSNSSFSIKEIICFTFYSKIQISAMTTDTFWISNHGLWKMSHSLDNPDIVISFSFSDNHFLLCLFLMSVFHKQTLSRCAGYLYRKVYKL